MMARFRWPGIVGGLHDRQKRNREQGSLKTSTESPAMDVGASLARRAVGEMTKHWEYGKSMTEDKDSLASRIKQFLDENHVMAMATASRLTPHAVNLFYVRDGFSLIFVSARESRHAQDLFANPIVSATVAPDVADYPAVRGVQITGTARVVTEVEQRARLLRLLAERYEFLGRMATAPERLKTALEQAGVYRLASNRIVLIDNSLGFAHKEELVVTEGRAKAKAGQSGGL